VESSINKALRRSIKRNSVTNSILLPSVTGVTFQELSVTNVTFSFLLRLLRCYVLDFRQLPTIENG